MHISKMFFLGLIVIGFFVPSLVDAQTTGEYLEDNPYYRVDRGGPDLGSDDSTIGTATLLTQAALSLSPSNMSWTDASVWKIFTVHNGGQMPSSSLAVTIDSGFETQHSCNSLAEGQNCEIRVRPNSAAAASGDLNISARFGGAAQATLVYEPPSRLSLNPHSEVWPSGDVAPRDFILSNLGAVATGTISIFFLGSDTGRFEMSHNCSSLNGGQTCRISIRPRGSDAGTVSTALNVHDNAAAAGSGDSAMVRAVIAAGGNCVRSSNNFRGSSTCTGMARRHLFAPLMRRVASPAACRAYCDTLNASCCLWLGSGSSNGSSFANGGRSCVGSNGGARSYRGARDSPLWHALNCN